LKTTREHVNIIDAFHQLGSYRAAARLLGTTHKTVRRAVERQQAGGPWSRRPRPISKNTDQLIALISDRVRATDGRISAKRLLPAARAAGYQGSARNFRRAVAAVKAGALAAVCSTRSRVDGRVLSGASGCGGFFRGGAEAGIAPRGPAKRVAALALPVLL